MALLESACFHSAWGRYSYLGLHPRCTLSITSAGQVQCDGDDLADLPNHTDDPISTWHEAIQRFNHEHPSDDSQMHGCRWIGFFSYDLARFIEVLHSAATDDLHWPLLRWCFYDGVAVYDHSLQHWTLHAAGPNQHDAEAQLSDMQMLLQSAARNDCVDSPVASSASDWSSNFSVDRYLDAVGRAKEYVAAGDIYQVNLSQRFESTVELPPHSIYMRLRELNPAWFAAYLQWDDAAAMSMSPELFLRLRGHHLTTRPIKGTRPRGRNASADRKLQDELQTSEKDCAELFMIVDLLRNDLGRVCRYGTVSVSEPRRMEPHPTVHHGVATIEGDLRNGTTLADLVRAAFPGGSITGAPKVRAMQIIEELEPVRRGLYTGSIGWVDSLGNLDLNIAIRTVVYKSHKLYCHLGGGIVADSDGLAEYEETLHKGRALLSAVTQGKA